MSRFIELFTSQDYIYTKLFFQRGLAAIYLIGFLIVFNQGKALIGEDGITPAKLFLSKIKFWDSPSLFFINCSDQSLMLMAGLGIIVSLLAVFGITEKFGYIVSIGSWFFLWLTYLSFVNIGQTWYGYGWESMLLETGFLCIFLGPSNVAAPTIVIWLLRWVCFRNMLGAGLIKLRGDQCWRDLTCMYYYYETQPIPNQLSRFFHNLPNFMHRNSVRFTFLVEVFVPFGLLLPWWKICAAAGAVTIAFHSIIIISGNLSWLNYLSIVLCIPCFSDEFFKKVLRLPEISLNPITTVHSWFVYALAAFVLWRSIGPVQNLFSDRQAMNRSFDRLHLVNTYGAFGSITKERNELEILGTMHEDPRSAEAIWKVYEFKGKPTDINRTPRLMSPYEWKIDWQMWFAAFGDYRYSPWILNFIAKLLQAQPETLGLIANDPFNGKRPLYIKVEFYQYHFEEPGKENFWKRKYKYEWLPPLSLDHPEFISILKSQGVYSEKNKK